MAVATSPKPVPMRPRNQPRNWAGVGRDHVTAKGKVKAKMSRRIVQAKAATVPGMRAYRCGVCSQWHVGFDRTPK